jgi:hypothetical protein
MQMLNIDLASNMMRVVVVSHAKVHKVSGVPGGWFAIAARTSAAGVDFQSTSYLE